MVNRVERILKRLETIKLERVERNTLVFVVINDIERISHTINFEGLQVGHLINTKYGDWLPTLRDLELLADYFVFLRSLCEITHFPSEETKEKLLNIAKDRVKEINVVEACKFLYGELWNEVLVVLKTFTNR